MEKYTKKKRCADFWALKRKKSQTTSLFPQIPWGRRSPRWSPVPVGRLACQKPAFGASCANLQGQFPKEKKFKELDPFPTKQAWRRTPNHFLPCEKNRIQETLELPVGRTWARLITCPQSLTRLHSWPLRKTSKKSMAASRCPAHAHTVWCRCTISCPGRSEWPTKNYPWNE